MVIPHKIDGFQVGSSTSAVVVSVENLFVSMVAKKSEEA